MLGTVTSSSHQEDQELRAISLLQASVEVMGSSFTCPAVLGTGGWLLSEYYTHTCAHLYPCWASPLRH